MIRVDKKNGDGNEKWKWKGVDKNIGLEKEG